MTLPANFANREVYWSGSEKAKTLLIQILEKDFLRAGLDFSFQHKNEGDLLEELYRYLQTNLNTVISESPSQLRTLLYLVDIQEQKILTQNQRPFFPIGKLCEEILKREIKKVYFRLSL